MSVILTSSVKTTLEPESTPAAEPATTEQPIILVPPPDISHIEIEDDTPVDSFIQEKQQRFLVISLYSSLETNVPFLAAANVGLFYGLKLPPLVPDAMLSLEVAVPEDWSRKENLSYFVWELGKPPEVAIEIVSNKKGKELDDKLQMYARAGVSYYAVFDPLGKLGETVIQVYALREGKYILLEHPWMEQIGLGFTLWEGEFEGKHYTWLRWCDLQGNLLLTGDEKAQTEFIRAEQAQQQADAERLRAQQAQQQADAERLRAEQAQQQADAERFRAEQAQQQADAERLRAEKLAALLRSQGINPDDLD